MTGLVLRLAGPLQSWGEHSTFADRDTLRFPTRSGITGILAAAQGLGRGEPLGKYDALTLTVRVDRPGVPAGRLPHHRRRPAPRAHRADRRRRPPAGGQGDRRDPPLVPVRRGLHRRRRGPRLTDRRRSPPRCARPLAALPRPPLLPARPAAAAPHHGRRSRPGTAPAVPLPARRADGDGAGHRRADHRDTRPGDAATHRGERRPGRLRPLRAPLPVPRRLPDRRSRSPPTRPLAERRRTTTRPCTTTPGEPDDTWLTQITPDFRNAAARRDLSDAV